LIVFVVGVHGEHEAVDPRGLLPATEESRSGDVDQRKSDKIGSHFGSDQLYPKVEEGSRKRKQFIDSKITDTDTSKGSNSEAWGR
jgi:hypothetical protein